MPPVSTSSARTASPGYSLDSIACVDTVTTNARTDEDEDDDTFTVALGLGDDVTCTVTNDDDPASLTVVKKVINDNGGTTAAEDFDIAVADSSAGDQGLALADTTPAEGYDSQAEDTLNGLAADTYTITEAGEDGYTWLSTSCVVTGTATEVTVTGDTDSGYDVDLGNGDDVTCTLVNDDDAPGLTVVKQVVNDDGGDAAATDFTVYADDLNDATDDPGAITLNVPATPRTTRSPSRRSIRPARTRSARRRSPTTPSIRPVLRRQRRHRRATTASALVQGGAITVTVGLGDSITCTLVNADDPAQLTVVKNVHNDDGGTSPGHRVRRHRRRARRPDVGAGGDHDGLLGFDSTASDSLEGLAAGTYTIDETVVGGYTWASFGCTDDTVLEGDDTPSTPPRMPRAATTSSSGSVTSVTCWLVNDDQPGSLTLYKKVVNDNGRDRGGVGLHARRQPRPDRR